MTYSDSAMGLIPLKTPLQSEVKSLPVTDGVTIYPGQPVAIASGQVVAYATGRTLLGVSMDYLVGDGEAKASINTDPLMTYRVRCYEPFEADSVGQVCGFVDPDAFVADTLVSAAQIGNGSAVAAGSAGANDCVLILGQYDNVSDETNPVWAEVKLHSLTFSTSY